MSDQQDGRLKAALVAVARQVPFRPDLQDVERHRRRRTRRRRVQTALLGLATGTLAIVVAIMALGPLRTSPQRRVQGAAEGPPTGRLLMEIGSGSGVFTIGNRSPRMLGDGVVPFGFSPDGGKVLAGIQHHEPSGLGYVDQVVGIDPETGTQSVILRLASPASLEDAAWSPDGSTLAYTYAPNRFTNASLLAQDKVPVETLCLMDMQSSQTSCFPELGTVFSFDWSPDGRKLLLGEPGGGEPMEVFDVARAAASDLVSADDSAVLAALGQVGFNPATDMVQFREPTWSPDGNYVGAMVGTVPMIFSTDGTLVAAGHPTLGANDFSWSTDDVMAYAVRTTDIHPLPGTPAAYVLDPSGQDTLILTTEGESSPDIEDVVWSPDGRFLALGNQDLVRIVDTTGALAMQVISVYGGGGGTLLDWES